MNKISQTIFAFIPFLATPVLFFVLAEGILNLGGGEKDIIWALVWVIWSLFFATTSIFLIYQNWNPAKWVLRSAFVSMGVMLVLWLFVFTINILGIA